MKTIVFGITTAMALVAWGALAQEPGHEGHGHEAEVTVPVLTAAPPVAAAPKEAKDEHAGDGHEAEEAGGHKEEAEAGHDAHEGHGDEAEEGAVKLSDSVQKEFGVEIATAGPGALKENLVLPGEVGLNQDRMAHVVPRFAGVVKQVRKNVGDRVKAGETLAVLEASETLATYEMKTLIDGTIIEKHSTLGEHLGTEHTAFVVADMTDVWIELRVYQKDLERVNVGLPAVIMTGHGVTGTGTVAYVSPTVDEHTRTALARVVMPNPTGAWRAGAFVSGHLNLGEVPVGVAVPQSAVQKVNEAQSVFVQNGDKFEARAVTLGRSDRDTVEVTTGLKAGERVVVKGAFTLKAELGKAQFGDGHGH